MNPWAFVVIAVGLMAIIIGVQGTQHDIASAITGHGKTPAKKTKPPPTGTIM